MRSAFRESSHPALGIRVERNGHDGSTYRLPRCCGSDSAWIGRIPGVRSHDSTGMNLLKRATLVTFVAGSGLLFPPTGVAAATAVINPEAVNDQSGVQGQSGELNQVGQSGDQGQSGDLGTKQTDQTGDQGQSGGPGQFGEGANDPSGAQGQAGHNGV